MAYSYVKTDGDGVTTDFNVPFPYLDKEYVEVAVDNVEVPFSWVDDTTVRVTTPPPVGSIIEVYRDTEMMVGFADGTMLKATDLNTTIHLLIDRIEELEDAMAIIVTSHNHDDRYYTKEESDARYLYGGSSGSAGGYQVVFSDDSVGDQGDPSNTKSLAYLLNSMGSDYATVKITPGWYKVYTGLHVPDNIELIMDKGACFAGTGDIWIAGNFIADRYRVFWENVNVWFTNFGVWTSWAYPEWWLDMSTLNTDHIAINKAIASGAREIIFAPHQGYWCGNRVEIKESNVTLRGNKATLRMVDGIDYQLLNIHADDPDTTQIDNIVIDELVLSRETRGSGSLTWGIYAENVQGLVIKDCEIDGVEGGTNENVYETLDWDTTTWSFEAGIALEQCQNTLIHGCKIWSCQFGIVVWGSYLTDVGTCEGNRIINTTIDFCENAFRMEDNAQLHVGDCQIRKCNYGLTTDEISSSSEGFEQHSFANTVFDNCNNGLVLRFLDDVQITGCSFHNLSGIGIDITSGSDFTIVGCLFSGAGSTGIRIGNLATVTGTNISGNTFRNMGNGIVLKANAQNTLINGCQFRACTYGIEKSSGPVGLFFDSCQFIACTTTVNSGGSSVMTGTTQTL